MDQKMKTIYLIRHCQAQGQSKEASLTHLGVEQSKNLANFLSSMNIEYIVSSPFTRAYDSVYPLASKLDLNIEIDDRLSERILTASDHPDWMNMLKQSFDDLDLCFEGGESSRMAAKRAIGVIDELLVRPNGTFAIATHGNLMSLILNYYDEKFQFDQWRSLTNPDVFQLEFYENTPIIKRIWENQVVK